MSTKKRKPLGSAIEEFVFGTNEAASPTPPEIVSSAPMPTPITPETALPTATPPQPEALTPEPVSIQSNEPRYSLDIGRLLYSECGDRFFMLARLNQQVFRQNKAFLNL